jgi:hypothetical protein
MVNAVNKEMALRIQSYEAIINEFTDMLESLDEYRAEIHIEAKQKKLFKTRSHEQKARRLIKAEQIRQGLINPKNKAA